MSTDGSFPSRPRQFLNFGLNKEKEVEVLKAEIHSALKTYAEGPSFQENV